MKTVVYLILACFISTGAFLGALNSTSPLPLYVVGFGVWAWFLWGLNRRIRKNAERRGRERIFQDYMRYQLRRPRQ